MSKNALKILGTGIGMLASLTACDGTGSRAVSGTFDIRVPFTIHSKPNDLYVSGTFPAHVRIEAGSSIDIQYGGKSHQFDVPRSAFKDENTLSIGAAEIGQDFSISSKRERRLLSKRTETKKVDCTMCDMCLNTQSGLDSDGNPTVTTGFSYSCACPGTRMALHEVARIEERFVAKFSSSDGTELGRFLGDPNIRETSKHLSYETECK